MMENIKNCKKCNNIFVKRANLSKKNWVTTLYCSRSCANSVNFQKRSNPVLGKRWKLAYKRKNPKRAEVFNLTCVNCNTNFQRSPYQKNAKFCKMACKREFEKNENTPLIASSRRLGIYLNWRKSVFERDSYTCMECRSKGKYLNVEHKKPFAIIFQEQNLTTIGQVITCSELWDINNGLTLCKDCHKKTKTYGFNFFKVYPLYNKGNLWPKTINQEL